MLRLIGSTIELFISSLVNTIGIIIGVGRTIGYALLCIGNALFETFNFISQCAVFVYDELRIFVQDVTEDEYTHIAKVFHNRLINVVGEVIAGAQSVIAFFGWTFDASTAFGRNIVDRCTEWFAWGAVTTRNGCVLVGNSSWMLIMLIPNTIWFLARKLIQLLKGLLCDIASIAVGTVSSLTSAVHATVDYFTEFPLQSLVGLFAIFLAIKYKHKTLGLVRFVRSQLTLLVVYVLRKIGNVFLGIFVGLRFIYGIFSSALELRHHRRRNANNLNVEIHGNSNEYADNINCSPLNKSAGSSNLCVICQDRPKSIVLLPCRHLCLCRNCIHHLRSYRTRCPLCREHFRETIQVYV